MLFLARVYYIFSKIHAIILQNSFMEVLYEQQMEQDSRRSV